jgi:site-specific DNA-methyltransferase (adenine-specific)
VEPYYQDSWATIYHGDCQSIMPQIGYCEVIFTDPPYGIKFASRPTKWQRLAGNEAQGWDDDAPDLGHILTADLPTCIWGGNYYNLPVSRGWLVWIKPDAPPSIGTSELAWTNIDCTTRHIIHSISATNGERIGHPTQKPLRVTSWALSQMPDGTVMDPYMGSGTTLRVCKDRNRRAIGIEINEKYCEMAASRLEQEVFDFNEYR